MFRDKCFIAVYYFLVTDYSSVIFIVYYCKNPEKVYRYDYEEIREKYGGSKNLFEIWKDVLNKVKEKQNESFNFSSGIRY